MLVHVTALVVGFYILAMVFEFPDILRMSAEYRLSLFLENSRIILPTYYLLALTGVTQILVSIFLRQVLDDNKATLVLLATVFGVLTGVFQAVGFIRWPILIPYIADAMANANASGVSKEVVAFAEGAFNRYVGMARGRTSGLLGSGNLDHPHRGRDAQSQAV
jgi:intracellular septation protein A